MAKRVEWIDFAKGIGIILVICGHSTFSPRPFNVWLCSFHMPLFFFLAGITFNADKYRTFKTFVSNKIKTLIVPYFMFAVFTWLWNIAWQVVDGIRGRGMDYGLIAKQAVGIFLQRRDTDYSVGVWFISCIFVTFILLYFINRLSNGKKIPLMLMAAAIGTCGYLYCNYIDIKIPWAVDAALVAVFFMSIGFVFQDKLKTDFKPTFALVSSAAAALALNLVFSWLNYKVLGRTIGMWSNNYGNLFFFLAESLSGIWFTVVAVNIVRLKVLGAIGKNSLYYYGVHTLFLHEICKVLSHLPGNSILISCIRFALSVIITAVVLWIFLGVYQKAYNKVLKFLKM